MLFFLILVFFFVHFFYILGHRALIRMGVKDRPQCYFDVELNREPGKGISNAFTGMRISETGEQPQLIFTARSEIKSDV